ncbi:hypothetical protein H0H93_000317, partial [Arthromyces matolae]
SEHDATRKALQSQVQLLTEERDNVSQRHTTLQEMHEKSEQARTDVLEEDKTRFSERLVILEQEYRQDLETVQLQVESLTSEKAQISESLLALQAGRDASLQLAESRAEQLVKDNGRLESSLATLQNEHQEALRTVNLQTQQLQERERLHASLDDMAKQHAQELAVLRTEHDLVLQEFNSRKVAGDELTLVREQMQLQHEEDMKEKELIVQHMEDQLSSLATERDDLQAEVTRLHADLEETRGEQSKLIQEASK